MEVQSAPVQVDAKDVPRTRPHLDLAQEALARFGVKVGDATRHLTGAPKVETGYVIDEEAEEFGWRPRLLVTATFDVSPDSGFIPVAA